MTVHHFTFRIIDKSDASDIREVETRAFGFNKEADLVASLLEDESACPVLSLLARYKGKAVGHILFTRTTFRGEMDSPLMRILTPLVVIPEYQGMGMGGWSTRAGIEHLRLMGCQTVFVLGHATYHPRHGFESCAGDEGYPAPYPIPEKHKTYWVMQSLTAQPMTLTSHIRRADPDETGALMWITILLCPF